MGDCRHDMIFGPARNEPSFDETMRDIEQEIKKMTVFCWLAETLETSVPYYYADCLSGCYTPAALKARRFGSKDECEEFIATLPRDIHPALRAVEHGFFGP